MTPERSQQIYELFLEVVELSSQERERVLEQKCAGDPEVRAAVEQLLASDRQADRDEFLLLQATINAERPFFSARMANAHVRCPNCDNPIEVVCVSETTEVSCPSCHSSFRVERHARSEERRAGDECWCGE